MKPLEKTGDGIAAMVNEGGNPKPHPSQPHPRKNEATSTKEKSQY